MAVTLQGPSKALGLVDISFGFVLATLFIAGFETLTIQEKLLLIATLGGFLGSVLAILDPLGPLILFGVKAWHAILTHQPFVSMELVEPFSISSPFLGWSRAKITSEVYLGISLYFAFATRTIQDLIPSQYLWIHNNFLLLMLIAELGIAAKVFFDIFVFSSKVIIVETFERFTSNPGVEPAELKELRQYLVSHNWGAARAVWGRIRGMETIPSHLRIITEAKSGEFRVVNDSDLAEFLNQGWEISKDLGPGKYLLRHQ